MKRTNKLAVLLLSLAAVNAASAANFPVGTHLIKGTLKDWQNKVLTSDAAVTIQAVATNGTVVASTTGPALPDRIIDPAGDGRQWIELTTQFVMTKQGTMSINSLIHIQGDELNTTLVH